MAANPLELVIGKTVEIWYLSPFPKVYVKYEFKLAEVVAPAASVSGVVQLPCSHVPFTEIAPPKQAGANKAARHDKANCFER